MDGFTLSETKAKRKSYHLWHSEISERVIWNTIFNIFHNILEPFSSLIRYRKGEITACNIQLDNCFGGIMKD